MQVDLRRHSSRLNVKDALPRKMRPSSGGLALSTGSSSSAFREAANDLLFVDHGHVYHLGVTPKPEPFPETPRALHVKVIMVKCFGTPACSFPSSDSEHRVSRRLNQPAAQCQEKTSEIPLRRAFVFMAPRLPSNEG